jgi:hypothetical protein
MVVVQRTPALQAAEDQLSLALLALVLGTRPLVSPAMVLDHLRDHFNIAEDLVSVRRTRPDDFIVRFSRREDLERVLAAPPPPGAFHSALAPLESTDFGLRWCIQVQSADCHEGRPLPRQVG